MLSQISKKSRLFNHISFQKIHLNKSASSRQIDITRLTGWVNEQSTKTRQVSLASVLTLTANIFDAATNRKKHSVEDRQYIPLHSLIDKMPMNVIIRICVCLSVCLHVCLHVCLYILPRIVKFSILSSNFCLSGGGIQKMIFVLFKFIRNC